jgi:hypothetical protein
MVDVPAAARDSIVSLSLRRRRNAIDSDEFGERVLHLLEDPGEIENIAIDIEALWLRADDASGQAFEGAGVHSPRAQLMLLAIEFGYRAAERGDNLDVAKMRGLQTIAGPSDA